MVWFDEDTNGGMNILALGTNSIVASASFSSWIVTLNATPHFNVLWHGDYDVMNGLVCDSASVMVMVMVWREWGWRMAVWRSNDVTLWWVWWSDCVMVRWCDDVMMWCCNGVILWYCDAVMVWWYDGVVVLMCWWWYGGDGVMVLVWCGGSVAIPSCYLFKSGLDDVERVLPIKLWCTKLIHRTKHVSCQRNTDHTITTITSPSHQQIRHEVSADIVKICVVRDYFGQIWGANTVQHRWKHTSIS